MESTPQQRPPATICGGACRQPAFLPTGRVKTPFPALKRARSITLAWIEKLPDVPAKKTLLLSTPLAFPPPLFQFSYSSLFPCIRKYLVGFTRMVSRERIQRTFAPSYQLIKSNFIWLFEGFSDPSQIRGRHFAYWVVAIFSKAQPGFIIFTHYLIECDGEEFLHFHLKTVRRRVLFN